MTEALLCVLFVVTVGLGVGGLIFYEEMSAQLTGHEKAIATQISGLKSANFLSAELYEAEQQLREEMKAAETERRQKEQAKQEEQAAPTAKSRPRGGKTAGSRSPGGRARTVDGEWR